MEKVKFLIHPECPDEVFAYFPNVEGSPGFKMCYSHIGQHSSCHPDYAKESRRATPEEYDSLKNELESIGYEIEII